MILCVWTYFLSIYCVTLYRTIESVCELFFIGLYCVYIIWLYIFCIFPVWINNILHRISFYIWWNQVHGEIAQYLKTIHTNTMGFFKFTHFFKHTMYIYNIKIHTQFSENTHNVLQRCRKKSQSDPDRFCLCSDGSLRFWMSVIRLDRSSRWSQFAFLLDRCLESSTIFDVVHSVLLRCRFRDETLIFLVRY